MKVLLTGGTGFIGSHVLLELLKQGHDVTVLARNANKVPFLKTMPHVTVLNVSMNDYEKISEVVKGKDAIVHSNSSSKIEIEDLGWSNTPTVFDVSNIMQDFNLVFHAYPHIISHLTWLKETFQQQKNKSRI